MNWNWDPHHWKRSTKLLLGLITIWPIIYIGLFMVLVFSGVFLGFLFAQPTQNDAREIDLIQLEAKIRNGEIAELRISGSEILASDRDGRDFRTSVSNQSTRDEIKRQATALDSNGLPRVTKISENTSQPQVNTLFPIGFLIVFVLHICTILLMFALTPLYIILAVKNERLDQTMRIVWVVLTCTAGMIANPVYWYLNIWRSPTNSPPQPQTP